MGRFVDVVSVSQSIGYVSYLGNRDMWPTLWNGYVRVVVGPLPPSRKMCEGGGPGVLFS